MDEARDESWHRMSRLDKVVFSSTLQHTVWPNTRICGQDLVDEIRTMKADSDVRLRTMGSLPCRGRCDGGWQACEAAPERTAVQRATGERRTSGRP